ncbi:MAG: toll/interleukin-1 receptor domain-containing protein [Methyloceanibacter sp.]
MAEVFISYSRQDREAAEAIARELQQLGVEVWWDHELLGGDDYRQRISKLLERTQAAIVIWSRRSVDSQWVMSEAAAARERKVLVPVTIDGAEPPIDFRGLHTTDLVSWAPGDRLPPTLLRSLSERLNREIDYRDADAQRAGTVARLARRTTQAWYADFESLLFFFIGQGFACFLLNLPLIYFFHTGDAAQPASPTSAAVALPSWVPYIWALLNGVIVAALYMRPALESRRLAVAAALFATAALLSLVSYLGGLVIFLGGSQHVIPLVGLATLAMLLCSALAQRGLKRP